MSKVSALTIIDDMIENYTRMINGKAPKWFNDGYMWDEASKKVVKDPNAFRWEK